MGDSDNQSDSDTQVRADRFTEAEKLALSEAVRDRAKVLFGKHSNENTKKSIDKAWAEVLSAVNAVSGTARTLKQVKEKWKNEKKRAKAVGAHNKRELKKTGGGKANLMKTNTITEVILSTIPEQSLSGVKGGIDLSEMNRSRIAVKPTKPTLELVGTFSNNSITLIEDSEEEMSTIPPATASSSGKCPSPEATGKPAKQGREKTTTECLLKRQVDLFEEQLRCMKSIEGHLKRRNEIEEEKLELKKQKSCQKFEIYDNGLGLDD